MPIQRGGRRRPTGGVGGETSRRHGSVSIALGWSAADDQIRMRVAVAHTSSQLYLDFFANSNISRRFCKMYSTKLHIHPPIFHIYNFKS